MSNSEPMTITILRTKIARTVPGAHRSKLIADLRRWKRNPLALNRPGFGR